MLSFDQIMSTNIESQAQLKFIFVYGKIRETAFRYVFTFRYC